MASAGKAEKYIRKFFHKAAPVSGILLYYHGMPKPRRECK